MLIIYIFKISFYLEFVLVVEDEEDIVVAPWDIGGFCDFSIGQSANLRIAELNGIPAAVWGDFTLLGVEWSLKISVKIEFYL